MSKPQEVEVALRTTSRGWVGHRVTERVRCAVRGSDEFKFSRK
jgi:hypothetical protein